MNDRSRIYTNVILTIIAIFLALIAFKPGNPFIATAEAQDSRARNEQQATVWGDVYIKAAETIAAGLRDIAASNESVAKSIGKVGDDVRTISTKMDALAKSKTE